MAFVVAKLPQPMLVGGRPALFRTVPILPVSFFTGTRSRIALTVRAAGESPEPPASLSVVESVQNVWEAPEDRIGLIGLGFAAVVGVWASGNLITTIDKLPLLPSVLEFIGILFSTWFTYRFLLYKPNREELFQIINKSISEVLGQ